MERKLRIVIVFGKKGNLRILEVFECLVADYEISAAAFLEDVNESNLMCEIKINAYAEDNHLKGYLFGVEKDLHNADIIVSCDLNGEVSEQVTHYCRENGKPYISFIESVSMLHDGKYTDLASARSLLAESNGFLVLDAETYETLEYVGVSKEKIFLVDPTICLGKYRFSLELRQKFRKYIGVDEETFLLLCDDRCNLSKKVVDVLHGLIFLKKINPEIIDKIRLVFLGKRFLTEKIHYLTVDLGLSKNIVFITQDTASFKKDLYSSADGVLFSGVSESSGVSSIFWDMVDYISSGLQLIAFDEQVFAYGSSYSSQYVLVDHQSIAKVLTELVSSKAPGENFQYRFDAVTRCLLENKFDLHLDKFLKFITLFSHSSIRKCEKESYRETIQFHSLKAELFSKPHEEALAWIEGKLTSGNLDLDDLTKLNLWKGQLFLKLGLLEEAIGCFEISTASEHTERESYLGLGQVAYRSFSSEEALVFYRKALALKPNDSDALLGLGLVYRKSGMPDEAVRWLGHSLLVDHENVMAINAITQSALAGEEPEFAIDWLERLRPFVGERPVVMMTLGQLYYRIGENEKGSRLVSAALELTEKSGA